MRVWFGVVALVGLMCVAGCGSGASAPDTVDATKVAPHPVKVMLEDVAQSGELGSGSESLRSEIEKIKASDEAKGKALLSDLDRLQKMSEPNEAKALAKKMIEKL